MKCYECNGVGYKKISAISCAICERCGGIGEVKETNFDMITKSPETLAEFIKTIIDVCYTCDRDEYPQCTICWCNPIALKNWLMEESE